MGVLDRELQNVLGVFGSLSEEEWAKPTKLVPVDRSLPHWTVFELAGHFDISIGLTWMLFEDPKDGQVGRDRVSFFIFPRGAALGTSAGVLGAPGRHAVALQAPQALDARDEVAFFQTAELRSDPHAILRRISITLIGPRARTTR